MCVCPPPSLSGAPGTRVNIRFKVSSALEISIISYETVDGGGRGRGETRVRHGYFFNIFFYKFLYTYYTHTRVRRYIKHIYIYTYKYLSSEKYISNVIFFFFFRRKKHTHGRTIVNTVGKRRHVGRDTFHSQKYNIAAAAAIFIHTNRCEQE